MVRKAHTHIYKPAAKNLQVCLSAYELLLPSGIKGFNAFKNLQTIK